MENAMAFQSVPETAGVVVRYTQNSVLCTMTFYGRKGGGYDSADITALAAGFDSWADTEFKSRISTEMTYDGVEVTGLEFENDIQVVDTTEAGAGVNTSRPTSNNVAFVLTRRSAFTGRSARGRVYFPVLIDNIAASNENLIEVSTADSKLACVALTNLVLNNAGFAPVIVSRFSGGVKREVGVTFPLLTYEYRDLRVDTMRGRLPD